ETNRAEAERNIDDFDSNDGDSDHGEKDEFWSQERRNPPTVITEPFNDELKIELQAASVRTLS
ncbi:hypothetical protein E4U17_006782, partial [Claviceps sp. LM77 group G4]